MYLTLRQAATAELVAKKSRFISACASVSTERDAVEFVAARRRAEPSARHTVYAYSIKNGNLTRYSDDGEPSGTAGMPTLNILLSRGITDAVIATTRYFGGTLLGKGGLVSAYTGSALLALELAGIARMRECERLSITVEYRFFEQLRRLVAAAGLVADSSFSDSASLVCIIQTENIDSFLTSVSELTADTASVERLGTEYVDF